MNEYTIDTKLLKVWKNGGRWDIWANHLDMVKTFIDNEGLKPLDRVTSAHYLLDNEMSTRPFVSKVDNIAELKKAKKYW